MKSLLIFPTFLCFLSKQKKIFRFYWTKLSSKKWFFLPLKYSGQWPEIAGLIKSKIEDFSLFDGRLHACFTCHKASKVGYEPSWRSPSTLFYLTVEVANAAFSYCFFWSARATFFFTALLWLPRWAKAKRKPSCGLRHVWTMNLKEERNNCIT